MSLSGRDGDSFFWFLSEVWKGVSSGCAVRVLSSESCAESPTKMQGRGGTRSEKCPSRDAVIERVAGPAEICGGDREYTVAVLASRNYFSKRKK